MTTNATQHVIEALIQSRGLEAQAQRMRKDAARLYLQLPMLDRHAVAKESGFSVATLELLAASLR